jgi:glycyl-tRNA synthetase beta chain
MPELLLELLSEEIPARMQKRASDDLNCLVCDGLKKAGLEFDNAVAYATPRRLTLVVTGLPEKQPDVKDERKGPQIGAQEQAINGFKSSHPEGTQIEERDLKGKTFYFAVINKKGEATRDVLKDVIDTALVAMANSWPKSMRWGKNKVRWARPLHSIVCLFDCSVIPVVLGPVTASDRTLGHRFLAPELFSVKGFDDYKVKLENAKVMLDAGERREKIKAKAETLAKAEGLRLSDDPGLLDEVAGLVEWPVILIGNIDDEFMAVPPEVLIAAMRGHQKYFSTLNTDGQLAAKFIFVSNMEANDGSQRGTGKSLAKTGWGGLPR